MRSGAHAVTSSALRRFTLRDEAYFNALKRVAVALQRAGIPYCLVGGGAVQAWVATLRTDEGRRSLSDDPILETALRETRDLDFATRSDEAEMTTVLNSLAAEYAGTHVLGPRAARLGPVAVSLTLRPDDLTGMSEHYDRFLDSRTPVRLKRGAQVENVPAIALEELVVTKVSRRGDKAKDVIDMGQLASALKVAGRSLDFATIRQLTGTNPETVQLLDQLEESLREDEEE